LEIIARPPRLPGQRNTKVGVNAPLMELVEDYRPEFGKQRILLNASGQDPFSRHEKTRVSGEATLGSHLPANFTTDGPFPFGSNTMGDGSSRGSTRLQQDHRTVCRKSRRDAGGLSSAGIGYDDDGPVSFQSGDDLRNLGVDRQWREQRQTRQRDTLAVRSSND